MKFTVINRYSDSNLPDKHGRWARIVYANNFQIAWISKVWVENKFFYSVKDYFPSLHTDMPCYSIVIDKDLEEVIQEVNSRFAYFANNSLCREFSGYCLS